MRTPWHLAAVAAVLAAPVTAQPAAIAGPAAQAPKPADSVQNCPDCPALAIIPAQSVRIGAGDDELDRRATERAHTAATIARPFAMATTEVTRPQYAAFVAQSGYKPPVGTQPECWREDLAGAPVKGRSIGTTEGGDCAFKTPMGGGWISGPGWGRIGTRSKDPAGYRSFMLGFRVAADLKPGEAAR